MIQTYNKKIGAWVKIKMDGKITDVKQIEPKKPFKGIKRVN